MTDEVVTHHLGEVVIEFKPATGEYKIIGSTTVYTGSISSVAQQQYLDASTMQPNGTTMPQELALQVTVCDLISKMLNALVATGALPPGKLAIIETLIEDFDEAALALKLGGSLDSARAIVEAGVGLALSALGDAVGVMVTAALLGAAGVVATSWSGPGVAIGGALAVAAGMTVSASISHEDNVDFITDVIFLGYHVVAAYEDVAQQSVADQLARAVDDYQDYVYRNLPPHVRPSQQLDVTWGVAEDDVTIFGGDFGYNVVVFTGAGGAVSIDLGDRDVQDGGSLGDIQVFTVEGVYGSAYADTLIGNYANNEFLGGAGNDYIDGGAGFDHVNYGDAQAGVVINLNLGLQASGDRGADTLVNIEGVIGSNYDDTLTGDAGNNSLIGGSGDDILVGGAGDDLFRPHSEGSGLFMEEYDTVSGGDGFDFLSFSGLANVRGYNNQPMLNVTVNLNTGVATYGQAQVTFTGIEGVIGSANNDTITGNAGSNQLMGEGGNDTISGGGGDDFIDGGLGTDVLNGGDGIDTLSLQSASTGVTGSLTSGVINGDTVSNFENLVGSEFDDALTGTSGANALSGARGDDYLNGGLGNDRLDGGSGDDELVGGGGNDVIDGGEGLDTVLLRGDQDDYLIEYVGDDIRITDLVNGRDGVTLIRNVEVLSFSDGDLDLTPEPESQAIFTLKVEKGSGDPAVSAWSEDDPVYLGIHDTAKNLHDEWTL